MKRIDYPNLIKESVSELKGLEKKENNARLRLRIQLLRLLKSAEVKQVKQVGLLLGISAKHAYQLWHRYRDKGLTEYLKLDYKPKESKLKSPERERFIKHSQALGFASQGAARVWIEKELGHRYSQQGISVLFQRFKIKAKTARPDNILGNKAERVEYKKSSLKG